MKIKSKQELENDFEWLITNIPDKIDRLKDLIPEEIYNKLDFTLSSLVSIGNYICEYNISVDTLKKNHELWDCYASYVGTTYRRNIPSAQWRVELEEESNIYYGIPALRTKSFANFYPHYEITTMLDRKRPDFLHAITKKHLELETSDGA